LSAPRRPADFTRPSAPRVYEYLLGGSDYFPADRALSERMMDPERGYPGLRALVRENRRFVLKSVEWTARMKGASQFLDLGCGLPSVPSVHGTAMQAAGLAAVCYVDCDAIVASHVRASLDGCGPGLAVVEADVTDPAAVLADEGLRGAIDLERPVAVILGGTLSSMDPDTARKTVAGFTQAMAPGSCVVISCVSYGDPALAARMELLFGTAGSWRNHGSEDVAGFFEAAGLRLVHGRPMDVRCWPACPAGKAVAGDAAVSGSSREPEGGRGGIHGTGRADRFRARGGSPAEEGRARRCRSGPRVCPRGTGILRRHE
jgi:hypothetical protein